MRVAALVSTLAACATPSLAPTGEEMPPQPDTPPSDSAPADIALPWSDDPCAAVPDQGDPFADAVARFTLQDDLAPPAPGQLLALGSSSIRRWETAFRDLAAFGLLQRGVGGARLSDLVRHLDALALRHRPRALLVFAGTNDVAMNTPTDHVVAGWRCLVARAHAALGPVPVLFIGITPTPSRWGQWDAAAAVNAEVARLASLHPSLSYVDVPAAFLETGGPPADSLFVGDGLHLSDSGYALWSSVVVPAVAAAVAPRADPPPAGPPPGSLLRVDLGPTHPEDGAPVDVDAFGIHWNAWHATAGGAQVLAGEALRALRTTTGATTGVDVVLTGGFRANGYRNGGLLAPPGDALGTLAVPAATGDFFYLEDPDDPGGLAWTGLDPSARHTLRLFASRASADEVRTTRYVVHGADTAIASLTTTGPDVGRDGYDGNDSTVAVLTDLLPDRWGQLHVDVQREAGRFAYLALAELEVQRP